MHFQSPFPALPLSNPNHGGFGDTLTGMQVLVGKLRGASSDV